MRPVRLEMEGFGTFRDRTVVDFADLELVAFVGPTGSGKSTVIDAMTFALYGSVPRYDNPNLVAPVVHQLAVEARVRLDFELGGRRYIAVRVVRRAGGESTRATTREARLEVVEATERAGPGLGAGPGEGSGAERGVTTVLAGNVTELDTEIRRLIGLDFTQFTRTIVLPQGEFARFIRAKAADRQLLLSQLLDLQLYARMGVMARERAKEAGQRAELIEHRLARLAHATPEASAAVEHELDGLAVLAERTATGLAGAAAVEEQLAVLRHRVEGLDRALGALAQVVVPDDLAAVDDEHRQVRVALEEATARRREAGEELARARSALDAAGDRDDLDRKLRHRVRLTELEAALVALSTELDEARSAHDGAAVVLAEMEAAAEAADRDLSAALAGADAAAWIAQLVPGQPCPVCAQVVSSVPDHVGDEALTALRSGAEEAKRVLIAAISARARAEGRLQAMEVERAQRAREAEDLATSLVGAPGTGELTRAVEAATVAALAVREAETAARRDDEAMAAADAAHQQIGQAEREGRRTFTRQRDAVADMGPPQPGGESLAGDWDELRRWSTERTAKLSAERVEVAVRGRELAVTKGQLLSALAASAGVYGIDAPAEQLPVAVAERSATARARLDQLRAEQAERSELTEQLATVADDRTVNEALGQHLMAKGFEGWLLAEALDDIVARANIRLAELSNGRYSLEVVDREFTVRDHGNADERRDIRTLSGGEIFLASLALALALAASIAELAPVDSPRLESIFLDEGFGTLDAETLDVLASAIEELSADGRLVAIVTHVRELAERMPVRFEVRKGPTTSVIERVEG